MAIPGLLTVGDISTIAAYVFLCIRTSFQVFLTSLFVWWQDRTAFCCRVSTSRQDRQHLLLALSPNSLPTELLCEVARFVDLRDVSALGTANRRILHKIWNGSEVWQHLANDRGLHLTLCSSQTSRASTSQDTSHPGAMRQAFRRALYRVDGSQLLKLGEVDPDEALSENYIDSLLAEAARMVRGLLPSDGPEALQEVFVPAVEKALLLHDPSSKVLKHAVEDFMALVRQRRDIFSSIQVDRFESAVANATAFQGLLEASMVKSQEVSPCASGVSTPEIAEVDLRDLEYDEDGPYEAQRLVLLDQLFEDLQQLPELDD